MAIDIKDVKVALLADLSGVLSALGVATSGGKIKRTAAYYHMSSPLPGVEDRKPSFMLWHSGTAKGGWKCLSSGQSGDILNLIVEMGAAKDMRDAHQWGKHFLGWDTLAAQGPSQDELAAARRAAEIKAEKDERAYQKKLSGKRGKAFGIWSKLARGFDAAGIGGLYLTATRGIDIGTLPKFPGAVRYDQAHYFSDDKTLRPAIVSLVSGPDGSPFAIHRIYLDPLTHDKITIEGGAARMVWPAYAGGVIRLSKGDSKLSPERANEAVRGGDARHCRPLVIVEGVEDGLAVMLACPELRVWAAVGLSNLQNIPDMPCISEFILCRDNDWDKPQAVAGFDAAVRAISRFGKPVRVASAHIGKDANDVLQAGSQQHVEPAERRQPNRSEFPAGKNDVTPQRREQ